MLLAAMPAVPVLCTLHEAAYPGGKYTLDYIPLLSVVFATGVCGPPNLGTIGLLAGAAARCRLALGRRLAVNLLLAGFVARHRLDTCGCGVKVMVVVMTSVVIVIVVVIAVIVVAVVV